MVVRLGRCRSRNYRRSGACRFKSKRADISEPPGQSNAVLSGGEELVRKGTTCVLAALAALFVGAVLFGQPAAAATVDRGPYLQVATPTSIIIRWRTEGTDPATTSVVGYGTTLGTLDLSANGTPQQAVVLGDGDVNRTVTEHEVALSGLAPDTRYYYNVGDDGGVNAGGDATYSFVTPPVVGTAQATRIWVIGDSGTANGDAAAVRNAYEAKVLAESRPTDRPVADAGRQRL